jgi:hypothetical protein
MATITATVLPGSPQVRINVDAVPAGYTVTVYRLHDRVEAVVRDAENAFASGGFSIVDYEIPGGIDVTYRAELFNTLGQSAGFTDGATAYTEWDPSKVWITDPLAPARAAYVEARDNFGSILSRNRSTAEYRVGERVIALLGARGKLNRVPLTVQTKTLAEADALAEVLDSTNVLVRSMPPIRMPRALYVSIPVVDEEEQDVQYGGGWIVWPLVGNEISSPDLGIVVPTVTWQTYIDTFATWADFNAAYLTWNDAIRNPPEA